MSGQQQTEVEIRWGIQAGLEYETFSFVRWRLALR